MDGGVFFIVLIAIAVFLAIALANYFQSEGRRKELSRWAASRGFSFEPDRDDSLRNRYPFACFDRGHSRYAYNILSGDDRGRRIVAFDYHYKTGSGKDETTHRFSAVIVHTGLLLKPLSIRRETFFDKVSGFLGAGDIELESAEFNSRFHVASPDRRWAFDVLPQTTMEFLLESPDYSLELENDCVLAYNGSVFSTSALESALDVIAGFMDRIPPSVLKELEAARQ
jgi:hypothetical protein